MVESFVTDTDINSNYRKYIDDKLNDLYKKYNSMTSIAWNLFFHHGENSNEYKQACDQMRAIQEEIDEFETLN